MSWITFPGDSGALRRHLVSCWRHFYRLQLVPRFSCTRFPIIFWNHRYTKRITLAAVYGATEVFMLQDRCFPSEQIGFLPSRSLASWVPFWPTAFGPGRQTLRKLGLSLTDDSVTCRQLPVLHRLSSHSPSWSWLCLLMLVGDKLANAMLEIVAKIL